MNFIEYLSGQLRRVSCFVSAVMLSQPAASAGLPKLTIKGVTTDADDPLGTAMQIVYAIADWVLVLLGLAVVIMVVVVIIGQIREAKREEGRWGAVLGAVVGGLLTIVLVFFLLNFAREMLPAASTT